MTIKEQTIKDQLEELIKLFEVEKEYPRYVVDITHSQLDTLLSMVSRYNKEEE